jgi:hypothetical protein
VNLNAAHIHLLVNHVPVFGTIFAALLIAWGLLRKSEEVLRLGLVVAVLVAAGTWLVQLTGDPAEHLISGMQDVQRRLIHEHEDAAELSTWVITAFGIASLLTLLMVRRRRASGRILAIVSLLLGLGGFVLVARAATLGGEIRHPEIRAGFVPPPPPPRPAGARRGEGGD